MVSVQANNLDLTTAPIKLKFGLAADQDLVNIPTCDASKSEEVRQSRR